MRVKAEKDKPNAFRQLEVRCGVLEENIKLEFLNNAKWDGKPCDKK